MNELTAPAGSRTRPGGDPHAARIWLDALASGSCDQGRFLREVDALVQKTPDAPWEVLSLLDQYYRLGKIKPGPFHALKLHLEEQVLGRRPDTEISVPLPLAHPQPAAKRDAVPVRIAAARHRTGSTAAGAAPAVSERDRKPAPPRAPEPSRARVLAEGDVLRDRYRLVRMLGQGGVGTVFEAIDQYRLALPAVRQAVAVKVLHAAVTHRQDLLAELRGEFWHLQSLSHPNIVRAFELDRDGDTEFFTMELLRGAPLSRVLAAHSGRALHRPYALAIIRDVGAALVHAHARGVVHGDINPGNILITSEGEVRVLDFGASRRVQDGPWIADFELPHPRPVATPAYASCQVLAGQAPGPRDDLYAFACVAYVLLTGRHPFAGQTAVGAQALHLRPRRPAGLTRRQWRALRGALEFARERRAPALPECLHRLDLRAAARRLPALPVLMTAPPRGRRAAIVTTVSALVLLMAVAGLWLRTDHDALRRDVTVSAAHLTWRAMGAGTIIARTWERALARAGIRDGASGDTRAPPAPDSVAPAAQPSAGDRDAPVPTSAAQGPVASSAAATGASAGDAGPLPGARRAGAPQPAARAATTRARIALAADIVEVPASEPMARVVVSRAGNARGDVSFTWWTESGTARPGEDYVAVAPRVAHIADSRTSVSLLVPVVVDSTRRQSRNFYVVIDEASRGASLGARTVTMVTVPGTQ